MKVAVIGAGSWGTALSQLLAGNGYNVNLWARRSEVIRSINQEHRNPRYLSDEELSDSIVATNSYADCLSNAVAVVVATPSILLRGAARALASCAPSDMPVIICSKGIEEDSAYLGTEIFTQEMGNPERIAVLSGPNHAEEVIKSIPSGSVIASSSHATAEFFQQLFASSSFRTYTSSDVIGVQLCAACKNPIAIAVGISYGLHNGDNTAAMLITRGLAEMGRLVTAAGGSTITCMGLAGTGDMVATCMSQHSRNRRFGQWLAEGGSLDSFVESTHMVVEGAQACRTLAPLAERLSVEMPITDMLRRVIWEGASLDEVAVALLSRPLKAEFYGI